LHVAPVNRAGEVDLGGVEEQLERAGERTAGISLMWANNETGVIQPVEKVAELAATHGIAVHSDAVQAIARVPLDFHASALSAARISGHKLGAPVGIGALIARRDFPPTPHMHGGLQERGIRSGTVNAAGAAALAAALRAATEEREKENA